MKLQNFKEHYISTPLGEIFCRCYGNGAPLLLLHGYPQTHLAKYLLKKYLTRKIGIVIIDIDN